VALVTVENFIICNRCSKRVKPPQNDGWLVLMVTAPDGANIADCLGHLCDDCRVWLVKIINEGMRKIIQ